MRILKRRRLNPTKRKRMTAKQIKHFGTKAQRAALKRRRSNPKRKRKLTAKPIKIIVRNNPIKRKRKVTRKRKNPVSGILSLVNPMGVTMRKRRKRSNPSKRKTSVVAKTRKRLRYVGTGGTRGKNRFYKYHYNPRRRRRGNPTFSIFSGTAGTIVGMLVGMAATHAANTQLLQRFAPQFSVGPMGAIANFVLAGMQSSLLGGFAGKFLPNARKNMLYGGLAYAGIKAVQAFAPQFTSNLGLGLLTQSSFYNPQMPVPNSMIDFYLPDATSRAIAAIPSGNAAGMGNLMAARRF